jgi:hypothetical protein
MTIPWREAFNRILPDLPKEELRKRIFDCEMAMCKRLEQVQDENPEGEVLEITAALKTIRRLQVEKLGYPDSWPGKGAAIPASQT